MAEPISIALGAVSLGIQSVQVSRKFVELIQDVRDAPDALRSLTHEFDSFACVTRSLERCLQTHRKHGLMKDDENLTEISKTLVKVMKNCCLILDRFNLKFTRLYNPESGGSDSRNILAGLKWSLSSKNEVKRLQRDLLMEKTTLILAINTLHMAVNMHATGLDASSTRGYDGTAPVDSSSHLFHSFNSDQSLVSNENAPSEANAEVCNLDPHVMSDISQVEWQNDQVRKEIAGLEHDTELHYSGSGTSITPRMPQQYSCRLLQDQSTPLARQDIVPAFRNLLSQYATDENDVTYLVEVFFDCLPTMPADISIDQIQTKILGSAEYRFEKTASFYPEQYVSYGILDQKVLGYAMSSSLHDPNTIQYSLYYVETARCWRNVKVDVTFSGTTSDLKAIQVSSTYAAKFLPMTFPPAMQNLLRKLLPQIVLHQSLTQVRLKLSLGESGQINTDPSHLEICQGGSAKLGLEETHLLQYAQRTGCKLVPESDIVACSRIDSNEFKVMVGSCMLVAMKVPFACEQGEGFNAVLGFYNEVKWRISVLECQGVSKIEGIILDISRAHLQGYLVEMPLVPSLKKLLLLTINQSHILPTKVLEHWARQLVSVIISVHRKGLVAGVFNLHCIGVRLDGSLTLQRSRQQIPLTGGGQDHVVPPELRERNDMTSSRANPSTDVFHLGLILWLLLWQISSVGGRLCAAASCRHRPMNTCKASHANPMALPDCPTWTPSYLREIIDRCREPDKRNRTKWHELAEILDSQPPIACTPADVQEAIMHFVQLQGDSGRTTFCDDCGSPAMLEHYHCNICFSGDYDLCPKCFSEGRRCLDPEHRMKRLKPTINGWVEVPH